MSWDLPTSVTIDGEDFAIENNCDYRVVLDCLEVYEDAEMSLEDKHLSALVIFYAEPKKLRNLEQAILEMIRVIDCRMVDSAERFNGSENQPRLMSWTHDFPFLAPAVSRVLGYDVRTPGKHTHWWTFLGAYQEIGECTWSSIVAIRDKKRRGKRLEKWEQTFCEQNRDLVNLPNEHTHEDIEWLLEPL